MPGSTSGSDEHGRWHRAPAARLRSVIRITESCRAPADSSGDARTLADAARNRACHAFFGDRDPDHGRTADAGVRVRLGGYVSARRPDHDHAKEERVEPELAAKHQADKTQDEYRGRHASGT